MSAESATFSSDGAPDVPATYGPWKPRPTDPACKKCNGDGSIECPACHGDGLFSCSQGCHEVTCETCYESGTVSCSACQGTGVNLSALAADEASASAQGATP